jgi:hypothetical protein
MADGKLTGNIFGFMKDGDWFDCQAEATLNILANVSEDAPCKVLDGSPGSGKAPWVTRTVDSRDWNGTLNANLLRDSLTTAKADIDVASLIINGNMEVDALYFRTAIGQEESDVDVVYSGPAIITNFSLTAGSTGAATTSTTFSGNGPLTEVKTPVTT